MTESKIDLTDRLRREKRWEEATQFKDATVKELCDNGMKRGEANEAGWLKMAEKYPPLELPAESEEEEPKEESVDFTPEQLVGLLPGSLKNFAADAGWVYSNIGSGDTFTEDPPSTGAFSLLAWARKHTNDFYGKILPKALQLLEKGPDSEEEAKEENLAHAQGLRERIGHLVDNGRYTGEP